MSTVANAQENNSASKTAVFIGAIAICGLATLAESFLKSSSWNVWQFASLLLVGALTARLKIKLPGIDGNMSVSLPFLLIAMTHLSMREALLTAAVSVLVQSVPKPINKFNPIHAIFNVSIAILAAGMGWKLFHHMLDAYHSPTICLVLSIAVYFFASTIPVAGIIMLTENKNPLRTWSEIVHLSFPYYVASAGLTSIASASANTPWPLLVGMTCVMFVMYRSFRLYFAVMNKRSAFPVQVYEPKAAAAGR